LVRALKEEGGGTLRAADVDEQGSADGGRPGVGVGEDESEDFGRGDEGGKAEAGDDGEAEGRGCIVQAAEADLETGDVYSAVHLQAGEGDRCALPVGVRRVEGVVGPVVALDVGEDLPVGGKEAQGVADRLLFDGAGVDRDGAVADVAAEAVAAEDATAYAS